MIDLTAMFRMATVFRGFDGTISNKTHCNPVTNLTRDGRGVTRSNVSCARESLRHDRCIAIGQPWHSRRSAVDQPSHHRTTAVDAGRISRTIALDPGRISRTTAVAQP